MVKVAPSILASDFSKLGEEIKSVEKAGADYIHFDVMDGKFVPNISIGPAVLESIRPTTSLPIDVHLMIEDADSYIPAFVSAGADIISVHQEACNHLHRTIQLIKSAGVKAGVVLNPATPVESLKHVLREVDLVLLMTVNPGFGGQDFIPEVLDKIKDLSEWKVKEKWTFEIEVDGGINKETAKACIEAGADVLVAGSAIFKATNRGAMIETIRNQQSMGNRTSN